jgi:UDP-N-acetyl-D-mannosaminuronic acid dehydrogenase
VTGPAIAQAFDLDVAVIGGCGRVGLPLAIALADRGARVGIYDISAAAVAAVSAQRMPFAEPGAERPLRRAIAAGRLRASTDPALVGRAEHVIVVIGTPAEEPPGPGGAAVPKALAACAGRFRDGQILILRSTVSPGGTARVEKLLAGLGVEVDVAFCPERIAEGHAMTELFQLPQIIAARTPHGLQRASQLFGLLTGKLVVMSPEEAELAKLFTNAWRYIRFAAANQLYQVANDHGLDFEAIRQGLIADYPRAADMPSAGLTAGPCLLKDTRQLAAAHRGGFPLGDAAIAVNEGMPRYLVHRLAQRYDLAELTVGVLGMAFKAGSDDIRSSLSYELSRLLAARARAVLCTDPYVTCDPGLVPLGDVLAAADLLVIAAPHPQYRDLRAAVPVADIWNLLGAGART